MNRLRFRPVGVKSLAIGSFLAFALPLGADEGKIDVRLEPSPIGVGEITELIIEASGEELLGVPLEPSFDLVNLEIAGGPSRRQNMSWINGQVTRTSGLSWYLRATKEGEGRVTTIKVTAGDRELSFPDEAVRITAEPQQRRRNGRGGPFDSVFDDFFRPVRPAVPTERPDIRLQAVVSDATPYRGQQLLYTLYLLVESADRGLLRAQVETVHPKHLPTFEGFWTQEVELPSQMTPESVEIGGKTYWRQPTFRRALFPYNAGSQTIEAAELELRTTFLQPTRFGATPTRPVNVPVESRPITLEVEALPPAPPGFSGAVGRFELESELRPDAIEGDEAATLSVSIAGDGQINGIENVTWTPPTGLKVFPPQGQSTSRVRRNRVTTRRSWDFTIVPEAAGSFSLPTIDFLYFDPVAERYETLSTPPRALTVVPDSSLALAADPPEDLSPEADPERESVTEAGTRVLGEAGLRPRSSRLWWLLSAGAGAALLVAIGLWLRRRGRPAQKELLARLREACSQSNPRAAAGDAEEAWREFLRERWDIPTGQPCSQWPQSLERSGIGSEVADSLVQLMDDLHYLRYAPQLAASESVQQEFWQRSRQLLRRLPR